MKMFNGMDITVAGVFSFILGMLLGVLIASSLADAQKKIQLCIAHHEVSERMCRDIYE